jgi:hypothetical protein
MKATSTSTVLQLRYRVMVKLNRDQLLKSRGNLSLFLGAERGYLWRLIPYSLDKRVGKEESKL